MKKLFFIAFALLFNLHFLAAQNSKAAVKPIKNAPAAKPVPVKLAVPAKDAKKQETTTQAPQNAPSKTAPVNTQANKPAENKADNQGKPPLKKDGTPDKRYKENQKLKKDGTPDKRFKENKATGAK